MGNCIIVLDGISQAGVYRGMSRHSEVFIVPAHERQMVAESRQDQAKLLEMERALGQCITALMFEAENALKRDDPIALIQIRNAVVAAETALKRQ
jgi:hypothetical protein